MTSMLCNSTLRLASRSLTNRSRSFVQKSPIRSLFSSPSSAGISRASRVLSAMRSIESTMPLHNAAANARSYPTWSAIPPAGACSLKKKKEDGKLNSVVVNLLEKPKHDIEDSITFVREIIEENKKEFIELSMTDGLCDINNIYG